MRGEKPEKVQHSWKSEETANQMTNWSLISLLKLVHLFVVYISREREKDCVCLIKRNVIHLCNFAALFEINICIYEYVKNFVKNLSISLRFFLSHPFSIFIWFHQTQCINRFFYQRSVVIKIDQRKFRIGDIDIHIRQPVRNLLLWFIIMGQANWRAVGNMS